MSAPSVEPVSSFGPKTSLECEAWARTFALEPSLVENAVQGTIQVLERSGEEASDDDVAELLARLRDDLGKIISDDVDAPNHARYLEELATRLDRTIERADVLEAAGIRQHVPGLL